MNKYGGVGGLRSSFAVAVGLKDTFRLAPGRFGFFKDEVPSAVFGRCQTASTSLRKERLVMAALDCRTGRRLLSSCLRLVLDVRDGMRGSKMVVQSREQREGGRTAQRPRDVECQVRSSHVERMLAIWLSESLQDVKHPGACGSEWFGEHLRWLVLVQGPSEDAALA